MILDKDNPGLIDINSPISPAVLAGILDIPTTYIYELRKKGILPVGEASTYKENIQAYTKHYKSKIAAKSSSMYEAKLEQDIRLNIAREEMQWFEIKKQKGEVADLQIMKELFVPIFHIIKSSLINLSRQHPEATNSVDKCLESLYSLGERIAAKAEEDANYYVQTQLEKEVTLPEVGDELTLSFGLEDIKNAD